MQWNKQKLQQLADNFNEKYFNNEIKAPIQVKLSRSLYMDDKDWGNAIFKKTKTHIINLNAGLVNADYDLIECTLVHELIHCLQDEVDTTWEKTYKEDGGHNKYFFDKCAELNKKHKFKYPLQQYVSQDELDAIANSDNGMYYVYTFEYYSDFYPNMPLGFFVKYLYDIEIRMLKRKGFKIKYFDKVVRKRTGDVAQINPEDTVKYSQLLKFDLSSDQSLSDQAIVEGLQDYIYIATYFNFDDGKPIVESTYVQDALQLLESNGYVIE